MAVFQTAGWRDLISLYIAILDPHINPKGSSGSYELILSHLFIQQLNIYGVLAMALC